jgi:hypothetical protein
MGSGLTNGGFDGLVTEPVMGCGLTNRGLNRWHS